MRFFARFSSRPIPWSSLCEWAVIVLLIVSVLWRGGKSLDITWMLTGVASGLTLVSHLLHRSTGRKEVPLLLWTAVMGFTALTIASYLFSTTGNYGLDEVFRTGSLGLLLVWIIRQSQEDSGEEFVDQLIRYLCIAVVAACAIGILVYVFQPVNRFVGTFFDYRFHTDYWPNAWAQFLLLTWPLVLYWVLRDFRFDKSDVRSRMEFLVRALILGIMFGCLFLSYSRGAILAFCLQLGIWGFIIYRKTRPTFPIKPIIPTAVMLLVVSLTTFVSVNGLRSQLYEVQRVDEKITLQAAEGSSSVSERFQFWSQSLNLASARPLLGWGPYSFRFVQPELQSGILATSDHPHNVVLKVLMERGVASALIFLLLLCIVFYRASVTLLSRQAEVGTLTFSLKMLIFLGLSGVLLHNMIDFNLQFVGIALPFWLLVGILMTTLEIGSLRSVPRRIAQVTEVALAIALLLVAFWEGVYIVKSSMGRQAEAAGDRVMALAWYEKSSGEKFSRDLFLSESKLLYEDSKFDEAQVALEKYFAVNEQDYRAWKRQGDIALLRGEKQRALESYTRAFERGKYNDISILHGLIEAYLALDRKEEIEKKRPEFDALLSQYAQAIQANAHYIALSPNVEEFVAVCNTLARLFREDAPRYQVLAAKADHHASIERERIKSRPPGFLW